MLGTLTQCEFSLGKTLMVYDMNLREMENYGTIYSNIGKHFFGSFFCVRAERQKSSPGLYLAEQNITSAHEKIAECKKEIQRAKRVRKNRQGKNIYITVPKSVYGLFLITHPHSPDLCTTHQN